MRSLNGLNVVVLVYLLLKVKLEIVSLGPRLRGFEVVRPQTQSFEGGNWEALGM